MQSNFFVHLHTSLLTASSRPCFIKGRMFSTRISSIDIVNKTKCYRLMYLMLLTLFLASYDAHFQKYFESIICPFLTSPTSEEPNWTTVMWPYKEAKQHTFKKCKKWPQPHFSSIDPNLILKHHQKSSGSVSFLTSSFHDVLEHTY